MKSQPRSAYRVAYDKLYHERQNLKARGIHLIVPKRICRCGCKKPLPESSCGDFLRGHYLHKKHEGPYKVWTPEQKAAYNLAYKKKPRGKEYRRRAWKAYVLRHPGRTLWRAAKERARKQNIPFSILQEDVIIPAFCPILKIPLKVRDGTGPGPGSPSIDRIIPALGYVPGNIAVVSHRANQIKSNATLEEIILLKEWAEKEISRVRRDFKL
jgi:hypothetical protein